MQFGSLKTPHASFYGFIYHLEKIFFTNIQKHLLHNPGSNIILLFNEIEYTHPCPDFPISFLIKLYARLRIYYMLKNNNAEFKNSPRKNRKINILMNF